MYPATGQVNSATHALPQFATLDQLAQARGMFPNALAFVPGAANGFFRYESNTPPLRNLWQDDLYNLVDWVPGGEGTLSVNPLAPGEAVPTYVWPTVNGEWRGPSILRDLGDALTDFAGGCEVNWVNSVAGSLGRIALDFLDAAFNPVFSIHVTDGASGTAMTSIDAMSGAEILVNGNPGAGAVGQTQTLANLTNWMAFRRVGTSAAWFGPLGVIRSATVPTTAVRYVRMRCQVFRSGGTNWPAVTTANLRSLFVLKNPTNGATSGQAISNGGAGSAATVPNLFDGNTSTAFASGLLDAANYAGAAYVGQQMTSATYYPRLAYVQITQSNSVANNASAFDLLMADDAAGPWETVASFANLATTASAVIMLPLPPGLRGRRCWRLQPTAGVGVGSVWNLAELRADYAATEGNPSNGFLSVNQNGQWVPHIPVDSGSNLAKKLRWMARQ